MENMFGVIWDVFTHNCYRKLQMQGDCLQMQKVLKDYAVVVKIVGYLLYGGI